MDRFDLIGIKDDPYTVEELTNDEAKARNFRREVTGYREVQGRTPKNDGPYIWKQADKFSQYWLDDKGYHIYESKVFDDCVGYHCIKDDRQYAVYMYAYGENKTTLLDGDYCSRLFEYEFSRDCEVRVVYLKVNKTVDAKGANQFKVLHYSGVENYAPEIWRLIEVNGQCLLVYQPNETNSFLFNALIYAYNHRDFDILENIVADECPAIALYDSDGLCGRDAFFRSFADIFANHRTMKLGYIRFNDVIYSEVPYIDDLGYFAIESNGRKIAKLICYKFDDCERPYRDFVKANDYVEYRPFNDTTALLKATPLVTNYYEKFAAVVEFDGNITGKYVLPIFNSDLDKESLYFNGYEFSRPVWESMRVVQHRTCPYEGYAVCGNGIDFANGYSISAIKIWQDGEPYSEPKILNEIFARTDKFISKKLWHWKINGAYEDYQEKDILCCLVRGQARNYHGWTTFITARGKRLTTQEFGYSNDFSCGLAEVYITGHGYGFIDRNMKVVIPPIYDDTKQFNSGTALCRIGTQWRLVDTLGNEILLDGKYNEIKYAGHGIYRASDFSFRGHGLAYYSRYSDDAGRWCYLNGSGQKINDSCYIYALDFENDIALVAKGEWTLDPKWDNDCRDNAYWTEYELWGAIDKDGNEVIPCKFDEIKRFYESDRDDVLLAHYGGWEEGFWGVIDFHGNWLLEPKFDYIDSSYHNDCIVFAEDDYDDTPKGLYSIKEKKVILKDEYAEINAFDNGDIWVSKENKETGKMQFLVLNHDGKVKFDAEKYNSIYEEHDHYDAKVYGKNQDILYKLDFEGNVLSEEEDPIFEVDKKYGLKDKDGKFIFEPIYDYIRDLEDGLYLVELDNKYGVVDADGNTYIPLEYSNIRKTESGIYICNMNGNCAAYEITSATTSK